MQADSPDHEPHFLLTRRSFCARAGCALSVAAVGGAASLVGACGGSPTAPTSADALPTQTASVSSRTLSLTIDAASPLSTVGAAAIVQSSLGTFLVARSATDAFTALTAICTHQGCIVSGFSNGHYVCPCHGATFSTTGQVTGGPAPSALRSYATQFANNVLTFTV